MDTYNYQTHSRTILGDLHTPVSTYLKVRDVFPQSALMESSDYHGSENNRSFIGLCPLASFSIDSHIHRFAINQILFKIFHVSFLLCLYNVLRNKVVTTVSNTDTQFHSAADGFHVFAII